MTTHPRKLVRDDVQARLQAVLTVPVYAGRARDLPRGTTEAVAVYVAEEQLSRPAAARGRAAGPITRRMKLEIVVLSEGPDEEVCDRLDALCRDIELALAARADLEPQAVEISLSSADRVRSIAVMTYSAQVTDTLN